MNGLTNGTWRNTCIPLKRSWVHTLALPIAHWLYTSQQVSPNPSFIIYRMRINIQIALVIKLLSLSSRPTILYCAEHLCSLPSWVRTAGGSHQHKQGKKRHNPCVLFSPYYECYSETLTQPRYVILGCSVPTMFRNRLRHTFRDTSHYGWFLLRGPTSTLQSP